MSAVKPIKVAILDLYNNIPNQGMRCIKNIITEVSEKFHGVPITYDVFETRYKNELPGLNYDIFISTGGPGSPFDSEGKIWEKNYFNWLDDIWSYNAAKMSPPKYTLFICHSYQMVARHFGFAEVMPRRSGSFGVMPVHKTEAGMNDPLFAGLSDPFYAADFREWQVLQPRIDMMEEMGAEILCLEKERPHVDLERAVMAIRLMKQMVGVQFHPEADPEGMLFHFSKPEQKEKIVEDKGREKYDELIEGLKNPQFISATYNTVIPGFLKRAVENSRPELVQNKQPDPIL